MTKLGELVKPALVAGAGVGFVGSLVNNGMGFVVNFIPFLTCCLGLPLMALCIVWPCLGGMGSVFMLKKKQAVDIKDGALTGVLAGVFGGLASAVVGLVFFILQTVFNIGTTMAAMGPGTRGFAAAGIGGLAGIAGFLIGAVVGLFVWICISTVGAVIGTVLFGKK
jgi:hypothetical protein